uniref:Estradiol 17-beta-dehydrogenase 11 n=1 Tax=Ascaris lumbricoides TaxID=6252 RepID=A0A0M3IMG7_ASCLU
MGSESFGRRIILTLRFIIIYIYVLFARDLPRLIWLKRKSIADQFAIEERAIVCILDINEVEGQRTVSEICNDGGRATFFKCDVSNPDSLRLCAKQIRSDSKLGEVDIVVCNAAVLRVGEILEMSDNDFKVTMDINVLGYIYTIRAFLPPMIERDKGHVVAIASVCSYFGEHLGTAYCTAKFAVRGLMDSLQMELDEKRKRGVAVTTVFPYFTETSLVTDQLNEPFCTLMTKCVVKYARRFMNVRYVPKTPEDPLLLSTKN